MWKIKTSLFWGYIITSCTFATMSYQMCNTGLSLTIEVFQYRNDCATYNAYSLPTWWALLDFSVQSHRCKYHRVYSNTIHNSFILIFRAFPSSFHEKILLFCCRLRISGVIKGKAFQHLVVPCTMVNQFLQKIVDSSFVCSFFLTEF